MPSSARCVVVTGAGRGLGRAYAERLAAQGATVVVNDVDRGPAELVAQGISTRGGHAIVCVGDVTNPVDARRVIDAAISASGRVDALITNAGHLADRSFAKIGIEEFDTVARVHLLGCAYVTHAAWPHMLAARHGRIVFVSSSAALWGNFGQANYAAGKGGLLGLMSVLKLEGARADIRINTIAPYAMTRLAEGIFDEKLREQLHVDQVAPLVAWLCSPECGISGEVLEVGGGRITRARLCRSEGVLVNGTSMEEVGELIPALMAQPTDRSFGSAREAFAAHMRHLQQDMYAIDSPEDAFSRESQTLP